MKKPLIQFIHFCLGLLILLLSHVALAGCNNYGWTASQLPMTTIPSTLALTAAQSAAPNNTPISDWYSLSSQNLVYCPTGGNFIPVFTTLSHSQVTNLTSGTYNEGGLSFTVYNTTVPGIGYIIKTSGNAAGTSISPTALSGYNAQTLASGYVTANVTINLTVSVRFIKTASLTAASYTLPKTTLVFFSIVTPTNTAVGYVYMNGSSVTVPIATCTVSTQSIPVSLPSINTAVLPSLNATAGSTPFNVTLNCPASRNVYMTLTDNSNPGRTTSIIGLAGSGSTASGIGIQVLRNGNPVLLGPDSSAAGNTNQFLIGTNLLGNVTIPFTARYIRTGAVQGGTVKAVATFTLSYQ
ncbi:type 1 fimbria pilin [Aquitalea magnusonii]|uniref:Type 1 fimbria pilin n=2 Tax=Chromobacteriaceae TaxID=1499392 RepID=A0A318JX55_9NEIS|nr:type 1 fimbria pilin [Aquitalea magnusonii]